MRKISILVALFVICMTLSAENLYAVCTVTRGKVEVSQGTGSSCTSIQTAVTAAALVATSTNPVIVSVLPGTYTEGNITMSSNVRLQGSGKDTTIVNLQGNNILLQNTVNNAISGLTLTGSGQQLIYCAPCDKLTVSDNKIVGTSYTNGGGIYISDSSGSQFITNNEVTGCGIGIDIYYSSTATVRNNLVHGNNTGIFIWGMPTIATVLGNEVIENTQDIEIGSGAQGNISHNVYDLFGGSGAVGLYNVKSDGTAAPLQ